MGTRSGLRVTIVGMHYAPEPSGNAPYTTALSRGLAARGHEVSVVTGTPHYPEWQIFPGYGQWSTTRTEDGVSVTRLRHYVSHHPNLPRRALMESTFGMRAAVRRASRRADVVVCVSPALFGTAAVSAALHMGRRPPMGLWIQDLYGRGLVETGGSSWGSRPLNALEGAVVRSFDGIAVAHHRFADQLSTAYDVPADRIQVIRNWTHQQVASGNTAGLRRAMGWADDDVVCLHAGNMGLKQGLENIVEAARTAETSDPHLRFVLLGGGNQEEALRARAEGLGNIEFVGSLPDSEFSTALAAADVLLVNERPGVKEMSVPSKLTSYFNSGRPVVAAVDPSSVTAEEMRRAGAGVVVPSDDPAALVSEVQRVAHDHELAESLGRHGRAFVDSHLTEASALDAFEAWLSRLHDSGTDPGMTASSVEDVPRSPVRDDVFLRVARVFYLLGVFLIPLLNIRLIGDSFTASDAALGVALLATAGSLGRKRLPSRGPILLACFLIVVAGTTATTMAISPVGSELIVVRLLFVAGFWPWMTRHLITTSSDLRLVVRLWLGASVIFGLVSLVQTRRPSFLSVGTDLNGRVLGLAGHPTDAGGVLCIGVVAMAGFWPRQRRWLVPWLAGIGALGIGLVLSGSVSGFLAAAIGLVVLFFRMRQGLGARLLTVVAVGGGAFAAIRIVTSSSVGGLSPTQRFNSTTSGQYDTLAQRVQTYHNGWQGIVSDPLLGRGMDPASGVVVQPDLAVHNMFLLAWYQGGILMLVALLVFVAYVMRSGLRAGTKRDQLVTVLFAAAATAVAFSMTSPLITQRYLWAPIVFLLATREVFFPPEVSAEPADVPAGAAVETA